MLRLACVALLTCAVAFAVPSLAAEPSAGSATVSGRTFSAAGPAGWRLKTSSHGRARSYTLTSSGKANIVSIPPKGEIAVSIYEVPLSSLGMKRPSKATLFQILQNLIGVPAGASRVKQQTDVLREELAGASAVSVEWSYRYRGRRITQTDIVTRRHGYAVAIEMNADTVNADEAAQAGDEVIASWRWR